MKKKYNSFVVDRDEALISGRSVAIWPGAEQLWLSLPKLEMFNRLSVETSVGLLSGNPYPLPQPPHFSQPFSHFSEYELTFAFSFQQRIRLKNNFLSGPSLTLRRVRFKE